MTSPESTLKRDQRIDSARVDAVLWVCDQAHLWLETIVSLCEMEIIGKVHLCVFHGAQAARAVHASAKLRVHETISFADLMKDIAGEADQFLIVVDPIALSPDALDRATAWIADDPRVGTVSFLSNAAGYLSFPHRNTETPVPPEGHDERTMTERLRRRAPDSGPVPIAAPEGGAVLVNASAIETSGGFEDWHDGDVFISIVEFGLRASRRGFNNYFDAGTFVWRMVAPKSMSKLALDGPRHQIYLKHKFFPGLHDKQRDADSPLAYALDLARAKAQGLRVLIDGSALGPQEMGTQLLIVALTAALAAHKEVRSIALCVPDPKNLPHYAHFLRSLPKIAFYQAGALDFPDAPSVDIIHRPYQPQSPIPWDRWRMLGRRSIITLQDLIAYRNGAYFGTWEDWHSYRHTLETQVAKADAVFSISRDVVGPIREERLSIATDALYVVENGVDFRSIDQPVSMPDAIISRGWEAARFLVILGANYTHKNRDFGLKIWKKLRQRGHDLKMILVGANVPQGSTRLDEIRVTPRSDANLMVLPDVIAEERNWLLRHAALVLYPTAAEGFGQIPFEAARFGRPSLYVSFGPLRELTEDSGVPRQYDLDALTARAELLLTDPAAAAKAIADTLSKIDAYTWKRTAERSVDAYFDTLARPPMR